MSGRSLIPGASELNAIRAEAMEFAGIGIYRFRPDGTVVFVDAGTVRLLEMDIDPSELVGRDIGTLIEYVAQPGSFRAEVLREGVVRGLEYAYRTLEGTLRWVNHDAFLVEDPDTGESVIQVVCHDITARKRAEEALRQSEARTKALLAAMPDMMFRLERSGRFLEFYANDPGGLAVAPADIVGGNIRDLLPSIAESVFEHLARSLDTGEATSFEHGLPMAEGERRYEARLVRVGPDEGLAIVRDITEMRDAQDEQRRLEAQVLQGQKMESLGLLAGGIAHDFNNLLTGVLGEADLVLEDLPPSSPHRDAVERIQRTARRAAELTAALLAYTGRATQERRVVDLSDLAGDMTQLFETAIASRAQLRLELAAEGVRVEADPTQVRQVLMNLLTNAVDAVDAPGGLVVLSTGARTFTRRELGACVGGTAPSPGEYATLEVRDSGRGMDEETQRQVFDPFFTTKSPGRGLGLATVLGIVRAHGGGLFLESAPGRGTTFRALLPRTERPLSPLTESMPSLHLAAGLAGKTVLVVDDEEAVRMVTRGVLEREGAVVLEAEDGPRAVELFSGAQDDVDLVLLDVTMPGMSGHEVLETLRAIRPDAAVVLMSGYMEPMVLGTDTPVAPDAFLHKPFLVDELLSAALQVLGRS